MPAPFQALGQQTIFFLAQLTTTTITFGTTYAINLNYCPTTIPGYYGMKLKLIQATPTP